MSRELRNYRRFVNRSTAAPAIVKHFDGVAAEDSWTGTSGGSVSYETSNTIYGTQGRKLTSDGSVMFPSFYQNFVALDLSGDGDGSSPGYNLTVDVWLPPNTISAAGIAADGYLNYLNITFTDAGGTHQQTVGSPNQSLGEGWQRLHLTLDQVPKSSGWDAITRITIQPVWKVAANHTDVVWDRLAFYPRPAKAQYMLRLDDWYSEWFNAHGPGDAYPAYLDTIEAAGMTAVLGMPPDIVGTSGAYGTWADALAAKRARHQIVNHTNGDHGVWRYSSGTTLQTMAVRKAKVNPATATMRANGHGEFARVIMIPQGEDNPGLTAAEHDLQLMDDGDATSIWYGGAGHPIQGGVAPRPMVIGQYEYWGVVSQQIDNKDAGVVEAYIDDLVDSKGLVCFFAHKQIGSDGTGTGADLDVILAYLQAYIDSDDLEQIDAYDVWKPDGGGRAIARDITRGTTTDITQGIAG